MRGSSRAAAAAGQRAFQSALASGADWGTLAEDLFGITALIDGNATLRRALADPSRDARAKRDLVARLFGGKVNQAAVRRAVRASSASAGRPSATCRDTVEEPRRRDRARLPPRPAAAATGSRTSCSGSSGSWPATPSCVTR